MSRSGCKRTAENVGIWFVSEGVDKTASLAQKKLLLKSVRLNAVSSVCSKSIANIVDEISGEKIGDFP